MHMQSILDKIMMIWEKENKEPEVGNELQPYFQDSLSNPAFKEPAHHIH